MTDDDVELDDMKTESGKSEDGNQNKSKPPLNPQSSEIVDSDDDDSLLFDFLDKEIVSGLPDINESVDKETDIENEQEKNNLKTLDNKDAQKNETNDNFEEEDRSRKEQDVDGQSLKGSIIDHPVYNRSLYARKILRTLPCEFLFGQVFIIEVQKDEETTSIDECYYICTLCSRKLKNEELLAHLKSVPHLVNTMKILLPDQSKDFVGKKLSADDMKKLLNITKEWILTYGRGRCAATMIDQQKSAIKTVKALTISDCLMICKKKKRMNCTMIDDCKTYKAIDNLENRKTYKNIENFDRVILIPQKTYPDLNFHPFVANKLRKTRLHLRNSCGITLYYHGSALRKYRAIENLDMGETLNQGPLRLGFKGDDARRLDMAVKQVNSALIKFIVDSTGVAPTKTSFEGRLIEPVQKSSPNPRKRRSNISRRRQRQRNKYKKLVLPEGRTDIHARLGLPDKPQNSNGFDVASDLESHPAYFMELKEYTTNCKKEAAFRGIEVDPVKLFKEFRENFIKKIQQNNTGYYFNQSKYEPYKAEQNEQFQNPNTFLHSSMPMPMHPESSMIAPYTSNNPSMQQNSVMLPNMNIPPPMQYNTMSALPSTSTNTGHMNIPTRNSFNEVERRYGAAHPVLGNNSLSSQDHLFTNIKNQISNRLFSTSRNTDNSNHQQSYLSPHELTNKSMGDGSFDISEAQQFSYEHKRKTFDDTVGREDYDRLFNRVKRKRGKIEDYPQRNTEGNWKRNKNNVTNDVFADYNVQNSPNSSNSGNQVGDYMIDEDRSEISVSALKNMSEDDFHQMLSD